MRSPSRRWLLAWLAPLSLWVAASCGPATGVVGVFAEVDKYFPLSNGEYFIRVEVVVRATEPFQAFDLALQWNPEVIKLLDEGSLALPRPHPDFDDDGSLFASAALDQAAGTATGIIDLRHGGAGVSGEVGVLHVWFYAANGGEAVISVNGVVAAPDGSPFRVVPANSLVFSGL